MKTSPFLTLLVFVLLSAAGPVFGQQSCEFNVIGTWQVPTEAKDPLLYRFASDGKVTVFSSTGAGESKEIASAVYQLDNPKAPKSIKFTAARGRKVFDYGADAMEILKYDDESFTCAIPGSQPSRWIRVDSNRYFIVLAARTGEFYDTSGPAFPILIKVAGRESTVDAVGTYSSLGKGVFGAVPPEAYKDFMREPRSNSEVMLRLEITSSQYEKCLKVLQTWERRAREGALLYPNVFMDNILLVKQVTESLNQCGEKVKLYTWIGASRNISRRIIRRRARRSSISRSCGG